jgi:ZIP family zinc transporter
MSQRGRINSSLPGSSAQPCNCGCDGFWKWGFDFGIWTVIAVICGLSSLAGYVVFDAFSPFVVALTTAIAAGAMLTMIIDTMIPEAFAETHNWAGLIAVLGYLVSFSLSTLSA